MARNRHREQLIRQWAFVCALHGRRFGMTPGALQEATGAHRATFYRDIKVLQQAGVPIDKRRVNGEVRYTLRAEPLPALAPNALQLAALRLARTVLTPLAGSGLVDALDDLLAKWRDRPDPDRDEIAISFAAPDDGRSDAERLRRIDDAISRHRRLGFAYRSERDPQLAWRTVDPVALRYADGDLYLIAWDLDRRDWRTFKVDRIARPEPTGEPADPHTDDYDEQGLFGHSVKIWSAEPVDVAIRLHPDVAWKADEYPLIADQTVECQTDGSAVVYARVAGTVEAKRWVLGWGASAEALEPPELRDAVREELAGALEQYGKRGPGVARAGGRARADRVPDRQEHVPHDGRTASAHRSPQQPRAKPAGAKTEGSP